jgi:hypothetical protein
MEASGPAETYVIDTATGERLDLDDPRPENIRIEDVAGGLSTAFQVALGTPS